MVVPSWNHVVSHVQAALGVSNIVVPNWNRVFSRVKATQGGIYAVRASPSAAGPGAASRLGSLEPERP